MSRWRPETAEERLEKFYIPEPMSGCWIWIGALSGFGYGSFFYDGKREQAHRVSYAMAKRITVFSLRGLLLLHSCDNPACINPDHVEIGTQLQNIRQAAARGRLARGPKHGTYTKPESRVRGAKNGNAVLTQKQVDAIRACHLPNNQIALLVGVSRSRIGAIKRGKSW